MNNLMQVDAISKQGQASAAFEELINRWNVLQLYGSQKSERFDSSEYDATETLPERLASTLLDMVSEQSKVIHNTNFQSLAEQLGTCRETVASILRAFRNQGFVELRYCQVEVVDEVSLREFGGSSI